MNFVCVLSPVQAHFCLNTRYDTVRSPASYPLDHLRSCSYRFEAVEARGLCEEASAMRVYTGAKIDALRVRTIGDGDVSYGLHPKFTYTQDDIAAVIEGDREGSNV